jgi:hypothetical protein
MGPRMRLRSISMAGGSRRAARDEMGVQWEVGDEDEGAEEDKGGRGCEYL